MRVKDMVFLSMLSALAFVSVMFIQIPIMPAAPFMKFDLKDCIIMISGLLYGTWTAFAVSFIVSLVQMLLTGQSGIIGFVMNLLSTVSFVCTVSAVYSLRKTRRGLIAGLVVGCLVMTTSMLLWNYIITPYFMGIPREALVPMLWTVFLPFNLLKGGINAVIVLLYVRPLRAVISAIEFYDGESRLKF